MHPQCGCGLKQSERERQRGQINSANRITILRYEMLTICSQYRRAPFPPFPMPSSNLIGFGQQQNDLYTVFQKSDAKIQITVTISYFIRIKYPLSGFN